MLLTLITPVRAFELLLKYLMDLFLEKMGLSILYVIERFLFIVIPYTPLFLF